MNVQNIDKWNLLGYEKQIPYEELQRIANHPKMKESKRDTISFSAEGLDALHGQKLPGAIDVEEMKRMNEILPKLKYNPSDDFLWAMRDDVNYALNEIKEQKGSYTLDDILSIRMNAYANQYNALQQAYEDGTREIYVNDGIDENGKLQYHKVTQEEDFSYLDKAYERMKETMVFSLKSKEIMIEIKEKFGDEKIDIELPDGYEKKMMDVLDQTISSYKESKLKGDNVDISQLVQQFFNKDKEFADIMRKIYAINRT